MPLFYFDIRGSECTAKDDEGMDFPDNAAALEEGRRGARDLLVEEIKREAVVGDRRVEVRTSEGEIIGGFPLKDFVR